MLTWEAKKEAIFEMPVRGRGEREGARAREDIARFETTRRRRGKDWGCATRSWTRNSD